MLAGSLGCSTFTNKEKHRDIVHGCRKPTLTKHADIAFEEDQLRKAGINPAIDDRVSFVFGQTIGEEDRRTLMTSGTSKNLSRFLCVMNGVCTKHLRVTAMSVTIRVDKEAHATNPELPKLVSVYTIRIEDHTSDDTAIQFLTDGMLIRQILSTRADIILAMAKQLLLARNDRARHWYDPFACF
ncbi:ATP-dependent RNA helicase HrpA [Carpediemonas membranifera]|uniref:ATP-dependent RNA helicase HrpA n=1 Tax=Carpediemonas membranifera TaxID=201153 RepID=A0A8J6AU73_9EUKA|nr:ATP-dependent RNA helicase HrpA [Carpediemonas membranifera]|eukprot:KAG9392585.1 ATP-dependent RNA helicase HrpA [Carpediemonas membranifera]